MSPKTYQLSFTAASMMLNESIKLANTYVNSRNWNLVKDSVDSFNLLQSRTKSRSIRVQQELIQRLKELNFDQLEFFVNATIQDQKHLLWYTICKKYFFIQEFAIEVLHDKYLGMNFQITDLDYDAFFNRKVNDHDELLEITDTTRAKLKQVVFRMLHEADLLDDNDFIIETFLSQGVLNLLQNDHPFVEQIFPTRSV